MILVIFTAALVSVAFASPTSYILVEPAIGPAITERDSTITLDPKIATPPVSVRPAIIADRINVDPAFYNENMQVGPANIEGAISGDGAAGHTVYQFIIKIGEFIVRGTNTVRDDESNSISVGPETVDETLPIPVNGLTINDGGSAAFKSSGPMSAGNAKVAGAISGKKAVGHTLCQFIIDIDKVTTDKSFDLSNFPFSKINCENIVRKWGPR